MRWIWVDRILELDKGVRCVAIKNVSLAEDVLHDHFPAAGGRRPMPVMPNSLIIEGMAQTGGLLISQIDDFQSRVVLAKVSKAEFHSLATPGDQLRLRVELLSRQTDGAIVAGTVEIDGQVTAELELTFAILDESYGDQAFFIPEDLCRILRSMRLFDVGVNHDGSRIAIPKHMLAAELASLTP